MNLSSMTNLENEIFVTYDSLWQSLLDPDKTDYW